MLVSGRVTPQSSFQGVFFVDSFWFVRLPTATYLQWLTGNWCTNVASSSPEATDFYPIGSYPYQQKITKKIINEELQHDVLFQFFWGREHGKNWQHLFGTKGRNKETRSNNCVTSPP